MDGDKKRTHRMYQSILNECEKMIRVFYKKEEEE
jgi:hypothetical protein